MTLEATLVRIAEALERLTAPPVISGDVEILDATKGMTVTVVEPVKKARGRPAKITTEEKANSTPAEVVKDEPKKVPVDDFLDTPTPVVAEKPATLEEVRAALQAYAGKNGSGPEGTAKARALMTKASSNGAVRLNVAKDVAGGDQGVLLPADYAAVIKAAFA